MDISYVIVAIVALCLGMAIGQRRKPREVDTVLGDGQVGTQETGSDQDKTNDMSFGARLFQAVFLSGWLIAWTAGILMAFSAFASAEGGASLFMGGWLIAAVAGWFWAVHTLWKLVTGQPVNQRRGR